VVKTNIREFTEKGIVWTDGTFTDNIDNVVKIRALFVKPPPVVNPPHAPHMSHLDM